LRVDSSKITPMASLQRAIELLKHRFGDDGAYHIVTYRSAVGVDGCRLSGRVVQRPAFAGPRQDDDWWDNLVNTYRRLDSERKPGVTVEASYGNPTGRAVTDEDGYYSIDLPALPPPAGDPWQVAEVRLASGGPVFLQQVLNIPAESRFGVISDIDDTVLESSITHWQTAAQLVLLGNAQTRRPLEGVAKLYQALQRGRGAPGFNPIFYVSASPWNLYDLLEDFFDLNGIPQGPILLRDVDIDRASFRAEASARSKLDHVGALIARHPSLKWVLMGDSGQVDAELYAQTVDKFPDKILAVYIRDVDPTLDSAYDKFVDDHIERISKRGVPMLRVTDSNAIAEHARSLGLIEGEDIARVANEVQKDQHRPEMKEAVTDAVKDTVKEAIGQAVLPADEHRSPPPAEAP
jgi:phosphatidate phosphatase APP1